MNAKLSALLVLSFKNLFRNKRRTLICVLGVLIGACSALLFSGFVENSYTGLSERFAHSGNGHVQIAKKNWFTDAHPERHRMELALSSAILKVLKEDETLSSEIAASTMKRSLSGIVSTGEKSEVFMGFGIDAEANKVMSSMVAISKGENLVSSQPYGAVLGQSLSEKIGAQVGDSISLLVSTDTGRTNAMDFVVVGVSTSGVKQLDSVSLLIPLQTELKLLNASTVDSLNLSLHQTPHSEKVTARINALLKEKGILDIEAKSWSQVAEYYNSVKSLYSRIFGFIQILLFIVTTLALSSAVIVSVQERTHEIGILRAIGASRLQILILFLIENAVLGAVGAGLGVLLALGISLLVKIGGGIPMPPPPGSSEGYRLFFVIGLRPVLSLLILCVSSTVLAAVLPALKASRLNIARAVSQSAAFILFISFVSASQAVSASITPQELLTNLDEMRGVSQNGFLLESVFTDLGTEEKNTVTYKVMGKGSRVLAVATSEEKGERMCILSAQDGMWMQKENMRKALRISPAQRLIGQASNGDIVSIQFSKDYSAVTLENNILKLVAKEGASSATYESVELEFDSFHKPPRTGKFYATSGKLLKTADYSYVIESGKFWLKSVLLTDAIQSKKKTKVDFTKPINENLPDYYFNPENLIKTVGKM